MSLVPSLSFSLSLDISFSRVLSHTRALSLALSLALEVVPSPHYIAFRGATSGVGVRVRVRGGGVWGERLRGLGCSISGFGFGFRMSGVGLGNHPSRRLTTEKYVWESVGVNCTPIPTCPSGDTVPSWCGGLFFFGWSF